MEKVGLSSRAVAGKALMEGTQPHHPCPSPQDILPQPVKALCPPNLALGCQSPQLTEASF